MHLSSDIDANCIRHCYDRYVRTTVDLPKPLLQNAKRLAARRGVTLSAVVEDALRSHLGAREEASQPPFQLHTVRGTTVRPDLDLDRTSALLAMDDEAEFRE